MQLLAHRRTVVCLAHLASLCKSSMTCMSAGADPPPVGGATGSSVTGEGVGSGSVTGGSVSATGGGVSRVTGEGVRGAT